MGRLRAGDAVMKPIKPPQAVEIVAGSLAAGWVARRAAYFGRALAAIQKESRPIHMFAENELLVRDDDGGTLEHLTSRYAGLAERPPGVPPQPEGMDPARRRSVEGMPRLARVRFSGEAISLTPLEGAARGQWEGPLQVTSRAGAGTLALALL